MPVGRCDFQGETGRILERPFVNPEQFGAVDLFEDAMLRGILPICLERLRHAHEFIILKLGFISDIIPRIGFGVDRTG
jgi:hypothetical protein